MQGVRSQVQIRGGTCEDPAQVMPGLGHLAGQEVPLIYSSQRMPPVSTNQRTPPVAYSSALAAGSSGPQGKYSVPQQNCSGVPQQAVSGLYTGSMKFNPVTSSQSLQREGSGRGPLLGSGPMQPRPFSKEIYTQGRSSPISPLTSCTDGTASPSNESGSDPKGTPNSSSSSSTAANGNGSTLSSASMPKPRGPAPDADVAASLSRLSMQSSSSAMSEENGDALSDPTWQATAGDEMAACRKFTFEQLKAATDNFSLANYLGHGQFDAVYKGRLMGCKVAIKRLEGTGFQGPIEYRTEVEVLSRMRHPNLVLLMGHCPEEHCLVYEFLSGGNLQTYLDEARGCRILKWFERVKILAQVANGLMYMHHHEPPIVHRDLNPGNVLIDRHMTVKLADVGLARLVHEDDTVTAGPRGTPGYIDPEEMTTSEVSVQGDVYAFGLIGLQLLLGERSIQKLQRAVAEARDAGGTLSRTADVIMMVLDTSAGEWPAELTRQLAVLLLQCADPQRMRRPNMGEEVHPVLIRASERASQEEERQHKGLNSQLMCPLSKMRMTDPVLAADGFTYERRAMDLWLQRSGDSPVTGQPLQHTFLTPNNSIKQLLSRS